jgi:hypothetical protein
VAAARGGQHRAGSLGGAARRAAGGDEDPVPGCGASGGSVCAGGCSVRKGRAGEGLQAQRGGVEAACVCVRAAEQRAGPGLALQQRATGRRCPGSACGGAARCRPPPAARLRPPPGQLPLLLPTAALLRMLRAGVARSIESDVDNLMRLISVANVLPKGLYVENAAQVGVSAGRGISGGGGAAPAWPACHGTVPGVGLLRQLARPLYPPPPFAPTPTRTRTRAPHLPRSPRRSWRWSATTRTRPPARRASRCWSRGTATSWRASTSRQWCPR